jgi:hypothetical protein
MLGIFGMNVYHKNRLIMVTTLSSSELFVHSFFLIVAISIICYIAWVSACRQGLSLTTKNLVYQL